MIPPPEGWNPFFFDSISRSPLLREKSVIFWRTAALLGAAPQSRRFAADRSDRGETAAQMSNALFNTKTDAPGNGAARSAVLMKTGARSCGEPAAIARGMAAIREAPFSSADRKRVA